MLGKRKLSNIGVIQQTLGFTPPPKKRARYSLDLPELTVNTNLTNLPPKLKKSTSPRKKRKKRISHKQKKIKSKAKMISYFPDEFHNWHVDRQNLWKNINNDPNSYYFNYLPPGQIAIPWNNNDTLKLKQCLKFNPPNPREWGLFSFKFCGKTGKEIKHHYVRILKDIANKSLDDYIDTLDNCGKENMVIRFDGIQYNENDNSLLPFYKKSVKLNNSLSDIFASSTICLAPPKYRNKYLFINFKNKQFDDNNIINPISNSLNSIPITITKCSLNTQRTIHNECNLLYKQFKKEIINGGYGSLDITARAKLKNQHQNISKRLFWRHAFLMAIDLNTFNISVPRVDYNLIDQY